MAQQSIAELLEGGRDESHRPVLEVYGRKGYEYAVYRAPDGVLVQYSDSDESAGRQRRSIAPLAPLRGEIAGLVADWADPPRRARWLPRRGPAPEHKAARYDRRVGDALVLALEGDVRGAHSVLEEIKAEVLGERTAAGRVQYLVAALVVGAGTAGLIGSLVAALGSALLSPSLWTAAAAGAVGAFVSIVLSASKRQVRPDLAGFENRLQAALRVVIGAVSGAVVLSLLDFIVALAADSSSSAPVLLVGFLAGFAERLAPDLTAMRDELTRALAGPSRDSPSFEAAPSPVELPTQWGETMPEFTFELGKPAGFDEAEALAKKLAAAGSPQVHAVVGILNAMLTANQAVCTEQFPSTPIDTITRGGAIVHRCRHMPTPHEF